MEQYEAIVPKLSIADKNRIERNSRIITEGQICKIPLSNGQYVDVNDFILDKINHLPIFSDGVPKYARTIANDKDYLLHRYIYYNLYHRVPRPGYVIDHGNRKPLDATVENLSEVLGEENARNRTKLKNCQSIYKGVYKNYDKWQCQFKINGKTISFVYENELHAAHHYNLMVTEAGVNAPLNDVIKPDDFVMRVHHIKNNDLPYGIHKQINTYNYYFNKKIYGGFTTVEAAFNEREQKIREEKLEKVQKILSEEILRNSDGIPIIKFYNNKHEEILEITVDYHRYHEIKLQTLLVVKQYVNIAIDGKSTCLSRYLINCTDINKYVDHRDKNDTNYQMNNLRAITKLQNTQNKSSAKGSTSKYVGVRYDKRRCKWNAEITSIKREYIGSFKTEYEAAIHRDFRAYQLNLEGNMFSINLPEVLQCNLFIRALSEEAFNFNYLFYQDN